MRKICLFIFSLLIASPVFAQNAVGSAKPAPQKKSVAIADIVVNDSVVTWAKKNARYDDLQRVKDTLQTEFSTAMSSLRVYKVVERRNLQALQQEQAFAQTFVDPNDPNKAKELAAAGVKYLVMPTIMAYEDRLATTNYHMIGRTSSKRSITLSVQLKIVDSTTGETLPEIPSLDMSSGEAANLARLGNTPHSDSVVVTLAKQMAHKLALKAVETISPAKIVGLMGKSVTINRGEAFGFKVGMKLDVFGIQELYDEESGETYKSEVPLGSVTVNRVTADLTYALLGDENFGIAVNCTVHPSEKQPVPVKPAVPKAPARPRQPTTGGSGEAPLNF